MVLRHGCLLGLAVALAAAPALGQAPPSKPTDPKRAAQTRPAKQVTIAQTITAPAAHAAWHAAHAGRGTRGHLREPARAAGRARQAAGDR